MAMRAWRVWGIGAALIGGLVGFSQAARGAGQDGSGRQGPAADHPGPLPARQAAAATTAAGIDPRSQAAARAGNSQGTSIRSDSNSRRSRPRTSTFRFGLARLGRSANAMRPTAGGPTGRRGPRSTWPKSTAESCESPEARQWYREVIKLAPGSNLAQAAIERLREGQVSPRARPRRREPPLADAVDIPELAIPRPLGSGPAIQRGRRFGRSNTDREVWPVARYRPEAGRRPGSETGP